MDLSKMIRAFALENAIHYEGKANPGSVVSKILGESPELKAKIKELMKDISMVVALVNKLSVEAQTAELTALAPDLLVKKEGAKKDVLKPLPNVNGPVAMRFAPSPSGPLHIGHAFALVPNTEYTKMYGGVCYLRLEDTNQDNIEPEAYRMIEEDAQWLTGNGISKIIIQSDRMETYYRVALQLLEEHHAYVCTCATETFKKLLDEGEACPCRNKSTKANIEDWHKMHVGEYAEGTAAVRLKTDINHKNPAMKDFAILRINETEHPRQGKKYRVWPLMNFSVAVDDHEMALTHVLRGKDHFDNTKRQHYIYEYLNWNEPEFIHFGRVNFEGLHISTTQTKAAIKEGKYDGWADVRIPFLGGLRRRGYQPEAIRKFAISMGISLTDKTVAASELFKSLNFFNKQILDPIADRYFFVANPQEITILDAPVVHAEFHLHPEHRKGGRKLSAEGKFLIQHDDLVGLPTGQLYRLMEGFNFVSEPHGYRFHSKEVENYRKMGGRIMHWLPASPENVDVEVLMDDGTVHKGKGERGLAHMKPGHIVQFERHYFARFEAKEGTVYKFVYTHK